MATKKTTKTTTKVSKPAPAAKKATPAKACCAVEPKAKATPRKAKAAACAEETCACAEETCACAAQPAKKTKAAAPKNTRVTFSVRAEVGSKVFLAGCFNGWDPTAKQMTDKEGNGTFTCSLNLPKGKYEYKFVINGTWCADPECTDWVQNDMGTLNSVKIVG